MGKEPIRSDRYGHCEQHLVHVEQAGDTRLHEQKASQEG